MKKRTIFGFAAVALVGMSMWAFIFGAISEGSKAVLNSEKTAENEAEETFSEGNWGLSFQHEGKLPVGNASADYLKKYDAYYIDENGIKDKNIYLTFDAGYENGYMEEILNVLKDEKVPATFFLVGNYIEENPELVKRMTDEGHTVGNHTMHHPDMSSIAKKESFEAELKELEEIYAKTTGKEMKKLYRPPQGKYSEENLKQAHEMGYKTLFWSLAYVDWYEDKQPSREEALNKLNERIHPGAVVLLHSTSKTNCKILKELIQDWKKEGYNFCDIDKLLT